LRLSCWSPQNRGLLLNLLGLEIPDDALAELDGTLVGARTRDLLLRLVEEQSRFSTVLLLLEDLHWIDSASEDLLLRIVGHEPALPLIILHTRRPEYHPPWAARPGVAELRLAPLSSSEALRIAQIRFGVDKLPETLARLIVDKAEGNALFVEEIARYLMERGTVRHTQAGLAYDPGTVAAALPASVQLLLTARVDRLFDTPQLVFALWFHCMLLEHDCDFSAAEVRAKLALSIAQRLNDIRAQAYARMALLFCSTILGRHRLEAAEIEGKKVLEICIRAGDNYILNWAYWSIAWDYVCRGLTREARVWALKLIDSGRQRQDDRALGMAYWTLAWIDIQDHRFADAIANAQRYRKTAATTFDRNAGMMASATGLLLEGRFEEGLAQLLALKKWALANGWLYSASGVDFAAGPALAATGRIAKGIRMLKAGIAACEATGSRAMASWNRISLAQLYLQMLSAKKRPSIRFILSNLGAIVWVSMFGNRRARQLLGEVVQNDQIHELSTSRGWIEIDLARLCILKKQPDLARQHLSRAHLAATAQNSAPMLNEIETIEAALS
jgi:hypothetical protein